MKTCETCRFFGASDSYIVMDEKFDGACMIRSTAADVIQIRRYFWSRQKTFHVPFPARQFDNCCGEHQPIPKGPSDE